MVKSKNKIIKIENNESVINDGVYLEIKSLINEARRKVANYVNSTILFVYWRIGKIIIEEQGGDKRAEYGKEVIKDLSKRLTRDFGEGYKERNLNYMRSFYLTFPILHTACAKLSWSHYKLLIVIKEKHIRDYYMEECIKSNWSVRELQRQINTCAYSRSLKNMINNNVIDNDEINKIERHDSMSVIKTPYILEFLGLNSNIVYKEKELEEALITHLQKFLLELGRGFTFVSRQKRISYDNENYYIDLVFYNIILRCYVVVDLKMEKLTHESLGQIDLYRNYFDMEVKSKEDNPTIGLLLVTEQDTLVAKYSSIYKDNNIFVSKYMMCLPTEKELEKVINEEKKIIEEYKLLNK